MANSETTPATAEAPAQSTTHAAPRHVAPAPMETSADWFKAIGALIFVIALFLVLAAALKRLQQRGFIGGGLSREPDAQLKIEQQLLLDAKTRLLLIRRGDTGHLLCLHPQGATLVESGIALATESVSSSPAKEPVA